jgi:hypothetical protein
MPTMKLNGFPIAWHTAFTAARSGRARCEQDIGAGALIGLQAANRVIEIRMAADEVLGARREDEAAGGAARDAWAAA